MPKVTKKKENETDKEKIKRLEEENKPELHDPQY